MSNQLFSLTTTQLRHAIDIKEKIEALNKELASLFEAPALVAARPKKHKMSAAGRASISAAAKARWAKVKAAKPVAKTPAKKRTMSAAAKAKLSLAAKARWAKVKSTGKKSL